jgi:hypothetical protein
MTPITLPDHEVAELLCNACFRLLINQAGGREQTCYAIGHVVDLDFAETTYIIKFSLTDHALNIYTVERNKYPNGSLIYYHDNKEELVTQATLFNDGIIED